MIKDTSDWPPCVREIDIICRIDNHCLPWVRTWRAPVPPAAVRLGRAVAAAVPDTPPVGDHTLAAHCQATKMFNASNKLSK